MSTRGTKPSSRQKPQPPSTPPEPRKPLEWTQIIVALIALIGAIFAGIATYSANRGGVELQIQATQTAEARQTAVALAVTSTSTPTIAPTNTVVPTQTPTSTIQAIAEEDLLALGSSCGALPRVLPENIDLDADVDAALEQIRPDFDMEELATCEGVFALGPLINEDFNGTVLIDLYVTNLRQEPGDIQIEKTFTIIVRPLGDVADRSSAFTIAAGAAGEIREFGAVELRDDAASYTVQRTYEEQNTDYFFLPPGQFEGFSIPFACTTTGSYNATIRIPYRYRSQRGTLEFQQRLTCPKFVGVWGVYQDSGQPEPQPFEKYRIGTYQWEDGRYRETR